MVNCNLIIILHLNRQASDEVAALLRNLASLIGWHQPPIYVCIFWSDAFYRYLFIVSRAMLPEDQEEALCVMPEHEFTYSRVPIQIGIVNR